MPGKVLYLELENDGDAEFELALAEKLGMTRRQLRDNMDQREFETWRVYWRRRGQRQQLERAKR
jgi:hypothetical protein